MSTKNTQVPNQQQQMFMCTIKKQIKNKWLKTRGVK